MGFLVFLLVVAVVVVAFFLTSVVVVNQYENVVIQRLGRVNRIKEAGLSLVIPLIEKATKVSLQVVTLNVPPQEVITRDNVTLRVNAIAQYKVTNAKNAIVEVENFLIATAQIAQTSLRTVLGQFDLDEVLSGGEEINKQLKAIIAVQTEPWGVEMTTVQIKDIELPQQMQRALARQAEAERERRAKIIAASAEFEASEKLAQAARVIASEPTALQLRYLQTISEVGSSEQTSTLIVPFPTEMLSFLSAFGGGDGGGTSGNGSGGPRPPRSLPEPDAH
jgi:regulator of protease activity HflC (stomatin/prohibitin superfamily)